MFSCCSVIATQRFRTYTARILLFLFVRLFLLNFEFWKDQRISIGTHTTPPTSRKAYKILLVLASFVVGDGKIYVKSASLDENPFETTVCLLCVPASTPRLREGFLCESHGHRTARTELLGAGDPEAHRSGGPRAGGWTGHA